MAQRIILSDDLDNSEGAETIKFAYQDQQYEIDLSKANTEKMMKALKPYVDKARKVSDHRGRPRMPGAVKEKIDYTDHLNYGVIHRGKVTPEEARLVRENMAQANANRKRHNQPEIDPGNEADAKRYDL